MNIILRGESRSQAGGSTLVTLCKRLGVRLCFTWNKCPAELVRDLSSTPVSLRLRPSLAKALCGSRGELLSLPPPLD